MQSGLLVGLSVRSHVPTEAVTSCPIRLVLCRSQVLNLGPLSIRALAARQ